MNSRVFSRGLAICNASRTQFRSVSNVGLKARLDRAIAEKDILVAPGAYDGFSSKLISISNFEAVYLTGAGVSYSTLGQPDVGLMTMTEMTDRVAMVARAAKSQWVIADGDTGNGNAMNAMRTVQLYEQAGASAIQIEDQVFPKRCGHLSGKTIVPVNEMVGKLQACMEARSSDEFLIIARTDARSIMSLDEAIDRAKSYADAGADCIFVESPHTKEELAQVAAALPGVRLLANMVEGGKTPLCTTEELQEMGYALVIYPNTLLRVFSKAGLETLDELQAKGTTKGKLDDMMNFKNLNKMLGIDEYGALEAKYCPKDP